MREARAVAKEGTSATRIRELGYRIGLALKAIDGLIELVAGLLLWLAPALLKQLLGALGRQAAGESELRELLAHWAGRLSESIGTSAMTLVIVFLISHGIVKLVLVYCLLRDYRWVFRPALAILGLFAVYQLIVLISAPTVGKAVLLLLDVVIVWLVWAEWRSVQRGETAHAVRAGQDES